MKFSIFFLSAYLVHGGRRRRRQRRSHRRRRRRQSRDCVSDGLELNNAMNN